MPELDVLKYIGIDSLAQLFNQNLIFSIMDQDGVILHANPRFCELTGYSQEELMGQHSKMLNSGYHTDLFFKELWETILTGKTWQGDLKNRAREGRLYWARTIIIPFRKDSEGPYYFLDVKMDITSVKEREEKWIFESEVSREVSSITKTGGWSLYPDFQELIWTDATYHLHGLNTHDKIDLQRALEFYEPEAREVIQSAVDRAIRTGEGWDLELPLRRLDGSRFWAHAVGKVELRRGRTYRIYGTFQDITQRKEAMEALIKSESLLKLYLRHTPAAVAMFDREMRHLAWSDRWVKDYKIGERNIQGVSLYDVFPELAERWNEDHRRVLSGVVYVNEEERFVRHDGGVDYIRYELHPWRDGEGHIGGVFMFTEVITERRLAEMERQNLEKKFQQTQKLESLGVLAGGIAHDFNNLLTGILGNTEYLRDKLAKDRELIEPLSVIEEAANRAAELCRQMLAYAGKEQLEKASVDLNLLIRGTAKLLEHSIGKMVQLRFDLEENLPVISADMTQLRQIVMNLVINASEAIGEQSGMVSVQTRKAFLKTDDFKRGVISEDPHEGSYILLKVTDNGCGMSPETLARIFEPFFTTKFTGRGLGLSAVMGIIRGHSGVLFVESTEGVGTTFEVYFPCGRVTHTSLPSHSGSSQWKGEGMVLLVEDELFVREIASRRIRARGFEVLEAEDGLMGLDLYEKHRDKIVLVITDLTMPKMNGGQLLEKLRHADQEIPCIMMSGYTQVDIQHYLEKYSNLYYLRKPADQITFSEVLRSAYEDVFFK